MNQAVERAAVDHDAAADAGPDREGVDVASDRGTPAALGERGGGNVGVEADRQVEPRARRPTTSVSRQPELRVEVTYP